MKNPPYRFCNAPKSIQRSRLDNVAIVPGNLLSEKASWQQAANRLPRNAILFVLPSAGSAQRQAMLSSASLLAAKGHQIRVVSAEDV
jgi:hypothetical protein